MGYKKFKKNNNNNKSKEQSNLRARSEIECIGVTGAVGRSVRVGLRVAFRVALESKGVVVTDDWRAVHRASVE